MEPAKAEASDVAAAASAREGEQLEEAARQTCAPSAAGPAPVVSEEVAGEGGSPAGPDGPDREPVEPSPQPAGAADALGAVAAAAAELGWALRTELGCPVLACILGGSELQDPASEELAALLGRELSACFEGEIAFLTRGLPGAQRAFSLQCGAGGGARALCHLVRAGQASGYGAGEDLAAGATDEQTEAMFCLVGDLYISIAGGKEVAEEASAAFARGATVLPVLRTGGASAGHFGFPAEALERPFFATEQQWNLLRSPDIPLEDTAAAVVAIVAAFLLSSSQGLDDPLAPDGGFTEVGEGEAAQLGEEAPGGAEGHS